jgi:hypothetical protein
VDEKRTNIEDGNTDTTMFEKINGNKHDSKLISVKPASDYEKETHVQSKTPRPKLPTKEDGITSGMFNVPSWLAHFHQAELCGISQNR